MINNDPKHGRWILPLIIVAMVVLTYTFVNGIEPAEGPSGSTGPDEPAFPTTPTSSTTTLPPEVTAFMVTLDVFESQLESFATEIDAVNNRWESRAETFAATREAFLDVREDLETWEDSVAQMDGVPPQLAEAHVDLVIEVGDLAPKVEDIVVGLEAPDDGALRRTAVAEFRQEVDEVAEAIQAIRDAATATSPTDSSDTTGTSEGATTTTTEAGTTDT